MNQGGWNRPALLEGILYMGIGGLLEALLLTGNYQTFVTPLLLPFLMLLCAACLLWGAASLARSRRPVYRPSYRRCWVLFLPALLWAGPAVLGSSYPTGIPGLSAQKQTPADTETAQTASDLGPVVLEEAGGIDESARTITFTTRNYYEIMQQLSKNLAPYEGYEVRLTGFVSYDDRDLGANQFILARYLMVCCINDLSPFGPAVTYEGGKLPAFGWYKVTGTLTHRDYHGTVQPAVIAKTAVPAEAIPGYVYPYH